MLGGLEVHGGGGTRLGLGPLRQRAVLGLLLVHANHVISLDRLIDELWDGSPPSAATSSLQAYVSNLRRVLEPDRAPRAPATVLVSQPPGYVLRCDPDAIDAWQFETLVTSARAQLARDPVAARGLLDDAL